jgi:hypothetical protein
MDNDFDFYGGLRDEDDVQSERHAAAEHFVRLKKQHGHLPDNDPQPLEKEAMMGALLGAAAKGIGGLATRKGVASLAGNVVKDAVVGKAVGAVGNAMKPAAAPVQQAAQGFKYAGLGAIVADVTGAKDKLKKAVEELKEKKANALAAIKDPASWPFMAAGGLLAGGHSIMQNRPKKDLGGKSENEISKEDAVARLRARGEEKGLFQKLKNRTTEMEAGTAKALREHPVKASLIGTGVGAGLGLGLAQLLGAGGK